jgi:ATP-dependent RNA helicase DDX10/DBP4
MSKRKRSRAPKPTHARVKRSDVEKQEVGELNAKLEAGAPPAGSNSLRAVADDEQWAGCIKFEQLPLSQYTQKALAENSFTHMTAIQRAALPHALCGRDVLGAAKTGSGKTLSFLVPV